MHMAVEPSVLRGKREGWLEISREGRSEPPDIKLILAKKGEALVKSSFEFTSGKFGKVNAGKGESDAVRLEARLKIEVVVELEQGMLGKAIGKRSSPVTAAELEADFAIMLVGSKLEIENVKIAWDAREINRTIPKKDFEAVYRMVVSAPIPERIAKEVDPQLLNLLELLKGSKISL
jgi:hypothetical protein